VAEKNTEFG